MKKLISSLFIFLCLVNVFSVHAATDQKVRVLVKFSENSDLPDALQKESVKTFEMGNDTIQVMALSSQEFAELKNSSVALVEESQKIYALAIIPEVVPDNIKNIGAHIAHQNNITGKTIKVAIVDSGLDYNNPEFSEIYHGGFDFVNNDSDPYDDNQHGTMVAGVLAARYNNQGIVGVAPDIELYALKVLDNEGIGYTDSLIEAILWAQNNSIDVLSMSFGSEGSSEVLEQIFQQAYDEGMLFVAASGNEASEPITFPARYNSVIAVGAVDNNTDLAPFSSTGEELELVAPGVNILTTGLDNEFFLVSGTSMAAPHVAGTAALVFSLYKNFSNKEVRDYLQKSAVDLGSPGFDPLFGYGLVNASLKKTVSCTPSFIAKNTSCMKNDSLIGYYERGNNCTSPLPENFSVACDFCKPRFRCQRYGNCSREGKRVCIAVTDPNACFQKTNLSTDAYQGNFSEFRVNCNYTEPEQLPRTFNITFFSPQNNQVFSSGKIVINFSHDPIPDLQVFLDNRSLNNKEKCQNVSFCGIFNAGATVKSGYHMIVVNGTFGNKRVNASRNFTVEKEKPRIYDVEPRNKKYFHDTVPFFIELKTDTGKVNEVAVHLHEFGSRNRTVFLNPKDCVPDQLGRRKCMKNISFNTIQEMVGYYVTVTGELLATNSTAQEFFVDNKNPFFHFFSPANKVFQGAVLIHFELNEIAVRVEFKDNDHGWKVLCTGCKAYERKKVFSQGAHHVIFKATDFAGNEGWHDGNFTVA